MSNAKTVMSQAANTWAGPTYIEDVFSTYLYTGTASTQTITNGIDLAGEGGMVWLKSRSSTTNPQYRHALFDTERGVGASTDYVLRTDGTDAQNGISVISAVNSDGWDFGGSNPSTGNNSGDTYASWTFRKAPRFFDVVTFTSDGTSANQRISHNLGSVPGCILVKSTSSASNWAVYHRSLTGPSPTNTPIRWRLILNSTSAQNDIGEAYWGTSLPTETDFGINAPQFTGTHVAYLFAHDPLGPSGDGSDGLIACGSFTTDGSGNGSVTLGWEPQWLIAKTSSTTGGWRMLDSMRGFSVTQSTEMSADSSAAEGSYVPNFVPTATGFDVVNGAGANQTYIYIAIRRGPMRQPESGTEVFAQDIGNNSGSAGSTIEFQSGFPVDFATVLYTTGGSTYPRTSSRLTQGSWLRPYSTNGDLSDTYTKFDSNTGWLKNQYSSSYISHMWKRAPGFFDVVAYTGDGVAGRTVSHNLGVAPELMIIKRRNNSSNWFVFFPALGSSYTALLNSANASANYSGLSGTPTATSFDVTSVNTNTSTATYIAYLFASLAGVSKVGSYTGNGSSQTIGCGFTSGARFVLIKRTDSTGDWYIWDTARGIVAANDPHLSLNTTAAEVTTDDSIDPDSSGFIVNQNTATNINVSSASYIFYAVA